MKTLAKKLAALVLAAFMCFMSTGCELKSKYDDLLSDYNSLLAQAEKMQEDADKITSSGNSSEKKNTSSKKKGSSSSSKKDNTSSKKPQNTSSKIDDVELELDDFEDVFEDFEIEDDEELEDLFNLEGYTFVVSSPWMAKTAETAKLEQEKTFFNVASQIEELFGCNIVVQGGNINTVESLRPLIMSGSKVADAVDVLSSSTLGLASAGYIVPWEEIGIDVSNELFIKGYSNLAKINNKYYGLSFLRAPEARMCVMFNKGVLQSSGINADGIYDLVRAKKWNWETLRSYSKTIVQKNTSSGKTNIWGIGGYYQKVAKALYVSNGAKLATLKNGKGTTTFNSANMQEALSFMDKLINEDKVYDATKYRNASTFDASDNGQYKTAFQSGKLGFMIEECFWLAKYFDKSFDYGIAPIPMGPKATNYITDSSNARVWVCTSTSARSRDKDESALILALLAAGCAYPNEDIESDDWWQYDIKREYFRNNQNDNLEMYNILLDTATVDYGTSVTSLHEAFLSDVVRDAIFCQKGTITSRLSYMGSQYDKAVNNALSMN